MANPKKPTLIPPHGGYQNLKSYQMATLVYDLTVAFCNSYKSYLTYKTYEQMIGAARSGKQNITEGSIASGTSKKIELKLVGIARASLEELKQDYLDYLRQHGLSLFKKDHPQSLRVRALAYRSNKSYLTYSGFLNNPETAANMLLTIIHQACFLLDQQLRSLEKEFTEKGGFTERLYHARKHYKISQNIK